MVFFFKGIFHKDILIESLKWELLLLTFGFYVILFFSFVQNNAYEYLFLFNDPSHSSIIYFLFFFNIPCIFFVNFILLKKMQHKNSQFSTNDVVSLKDEPHSFNQLSLAWLQIYFVFISFLIFIIFFFLVTLLFSSFYSYSDVFQNFIIELFFYNVTNFEIVLILNVFMVIILMPVDFILILK